MEIGEDERECSDAEWQVDVEQPAPGEVIRDPSAGQRPRDRGDAKDGADVAHVPAALAGADDVPDNGLGERHYGAHPEALNSAGGDQPPEALCRPGQDGTQHEDHQPRNVEAAPAVDV
jgi:hypothetical protein